jgi:hypothetical protein
MTLKSSRAQKRKTNRTRPAIEGLEDRKLLSRAAVGPAVADGSGGTFSQDFRVFSYTTPTGGHATIQVVGLGNLQGTTAPGGVLNLVFGATNAYSKITGAVKGGGGHAPLESIQNSQLINAGASNSLSGVGGNVVQSFLLSPFDLVAGGRINLTSGVNALILDSIGPDTQINLRALPPAPSTQVSLPTSNLLVSTTPTSAGSTSSVTIFRAFSTTTSSTASSDTTLQALESTTITSPYGVSTTYLTNGNGSQTVTSVSGEFKSVGNIVEPLPTGQPIQTVPPAPPGIIMKVNRINGKTKGPINVLTDPRIFGYDPVTGQVIRFALNLKTNTGVVDSTFAPISVPGAPTVAGLDIAWNGSQRVLLVSSGTTVYAYNASTGAFVGQFTDTNSFIGSLPINSIGATDTLTVLGSYQTNQLYAIDLQASLQSGVAQPARGNPQPFTPQAQFTLLGGLTSSPGTNIVFATIAAHLDSTQPDQTQLGIQAVSTASVATMKGQGSVLSNHLSALANTPVKQLGAFVNVPAVQPATGPPGQALGSIDQTLALVTGASGGTNTLTTETGKITLAYPNPLAGLSETFRPDLVGSALIDIQGTVQSIRGGTATGMVLNDTGNLNLVKFQSLENSTIVGQPISHLEIAKRSHVIVLTPSRTVAGRNGVTVFKGLNRIGPLTQPND